MKKTRKSKSSDQNELSQYCESIARYPLLDREEEHKLAVQSKKKGKRAQAAKDKLVVSNLRFVVKIANKYRNYTRSQKITLMDLIQEGNRALIKAVEKFDPSRGIRLTSYAVWWIKAYMQNAIIKNFSLVKMGTTQRERVLFFKMARLNEILQETDSDIAEELRQELATETKLSVDNVRFMERRLRSQDSSADQLVTNASQKYDTNTTFKDLFTYDHSWQEQVEEANKTEAQKKLISQAMEKLEPREREILTRRWLGEDKVTLQTIGSEYGLSRERIRQIESRAFNKMKKFLSNQEVNI